MAKRVKLKTYQTDPLTWLTERFGDPETNYLWSKHGGPYETHKWDGTPDPFYTAIKALSEKKWVGIESATSTGKTYILPRIVYWFLDVFPNSLVITTAPKRDQLQKILWKEMGTAFPMFKRIRSYAELLTLNITVDGRVKKQNKSNINELTKIMEVGSGHEAIGFVSGVAAGEESATRMQGFHREHMMFVLDECPGLNPAIIKAIENTSTAENNLVIAVGNPDSHVDALHQFCELSKTEHIVISAMDHPNIVLNKAVIKGAVTVGSIEFRKEEYGEETPFYKSRVRGICPTEGVDSLFKAEMLDQCNIYDKQKFMNIEFLRDTKNNNALGIDVANSTDGDKACLAWGRGNELQEMQEFFCPDANYLAWNVMKEDHEIRTMSKNLTADYNVVYNTSKLKDFNVSPNHIGVDVVGVGVATINTFWNAGIKAIGLQGGQLEDFIKKDKEGKPLYEFSNLRSQMYFEAMLDLRNCKIRINLPGKVYIALKKELITMKYRIMGGKIAVEAKEDIKKRLGGKSPNMADAFVYWNWVRKNYYKGIAHLPFGGQGKK